MPGIKANSDLVNELIDFCGRICRTKSVRARSISRLNSLVSLPASSTSACCVTAIGGTEEQGSYEEQAANPASMERME